jgi:hypothetical protein
MLWALLCALQLSSADSLRIGSLARPPGQDKAFDSAELGSPQVRLRTHQGAALVWLFRSRDTVFLAASRIFVGCSTAAWLPGAVTVGGKPPRDDPDWRLGADRAGGGWEVMSRDWRKGEPTPATGPRVVHRRRWAAAAGCLSDPRWLKRRLPSGCLSARSSHPAGR